MGAELQLLVSCPMGQTLSCPCPCPPWLSHHLKESVRPLYSVRFIAFLMATAS